MTDLHCGCIKDRRNRNLELFVKMKNRDIKSCFRKYKELPMDTFGVPAEIKIKRR